MKPMTLTEPIRFRPLLKQYLWGGRRLGTELGKPLGNDDHYAESWEIVDHGRDQSVVADGPFAGMTLHELVTAYGESLFSRHHPRPQFPLLFKFLDAQQTLSVQVHPNDAQAARLSPPDLGKTEAWVVLAASPGSKIYAGLQPGVDRAALERALAVGACDRCLHQFEPSVGDCVFLEAGTVHALGAGLVIAEIQQASNTTYRLFDWNRVDRDGKPRPLHIKESLDTIDFSRGPVNPQMPHSETEPEAELLVDCDKFVLKRWPIAEPRSWGGDNRFHILSLIEGEATITITDGAQRLSRGDTVLIPAASVGSRLVPKGRAVLLDMHLP